MHNKYSAPLLSYVRPCAVWGCLRGAAAGSNHARAPLSITDVVRVALHLALAIWLLACGFLSGACIARRFGLSLPLPLPLSASGGGGVVAPIYWDVAALLTMPATFAVIFLAVELGHPPFEGPLRRLIVLLRFSTFVLIHVWAFLARTWLYFSILNAAFSVLLTALGLQSIVSPQLHGIIIAVGMSLSTALYM